jgi:membrane protein implicated in regulation of membrane protease activity
MIMHIRSDMKYTLLRHRTLIRYVLLQLPGLSVLILILMVAQSYIDLAKYAFWGIVGLWILKDILLYPVVGRYYDPNYPKDRFSMIGLSGVAQEPLKPTGYVRVRGELWKAKILDQQTHINAGESIIIRGVDGLTLLVDQNRSVLDRVMDKQLIEGGGN